MQFELLSDSASIQQVTQQPFASELFDVLMRFREAVRNAEVDWAGFQPVQEYAGVCFWAIRKLEYSFAAQAFGGIEARAPAPMRVLDVGCGVVPLCNWLSRRGHHVTAIDPDAEIIDFLDRYNLNAFYDSNVDFKVGHSEQLEFETASFDVVTCVSVLEHVVPGNDRLSLLEIARVLKPGGQLILTFDVAPPPPPDEGDTEWPADRRRYAKPFSPRAAARLLGAISSGYVVSAEPLPAGLDTLTWADVSEFWRATQQHDEREELEREYLAIAGILQRRPIEISLSASDLAAAYAEGQAALEERLDWFQRRADERLELIDSLSQRATAYQRQLQEKESLIQDLDAAARARLEVAHELGRQLSATRADVDTRTSIDRLGHVLAEQTRMLERLEERVEQPVDLQELPPPSATTGRRNGGPRGGPPGPSARDSASDAYVLDAIARLQDDMERLVQASRESSHQAELRALQREKQAAEAVAEARESVIQEQRRAIDYLRGRGLTRRVRSLFEPRIGVLYHHDPRPMVIPAWYESTPPLVTGPRVSLITATLNQGHFLERTLKSVLGQQYPNLEYIIQDGGSTDETLAILGGYSADLARVDSHPDGGLGEALDNGFQLATGEILAYLNSDDLLLPGTLNYVARYFIAHPEVDVVYGHRVLIDEHDQEIGRWVLPRHDDAILPWADYVPQETLFWRRGIWDKAGGHIDRTLRFAVDWDLLLRFREAKATMRRLPRFLGAFRVHENQKTSAEMRGVGAVEIEHLRDRALGRPVSQSQIHRALEPYLRSHFVYHKLYRMRLLRY
jgi:glycosyltransferase involved in cell wall biosynthesis/SAM-dependent methyltransferase